MKLLGSILQDVSYALRTMRRSPVLTAAAVLSLALGIGANTAIFSLIDAIMLRNLPVRSPQELVQIGWSMKDWPDRFVDSTSGRGIPMGGVNTRLPFSYDTFRQLRERSTTLSGVMGRYHLYQSTIVVANGSADTASADLVSGNFFDVLGLAPVTGRLLADVDDRDGAQLMAVLSHAYWVRRFAADPNIAGKTMLLNGIPFTIAGVASAGFQGVEVGVGVDVYLPLAAQPVVAKTRPKPDMRTQADWWWVEIVGRRRPGVSEVQARSELETLFRQSLTAIGSEPVKPQDYPAFVLAQAAQGQSGLRMRFAQPLNVLMTAVGFVLLIGCANVANLLMARAVARRKEMAMRNALGAGPLRLFRQMLVESTVLALAGGLLGLALARWGTLALVRVFFGAESSSLDVQANSTVLTFLIGVSLLVGLLFGLAPALQSARVDLNSMLKAAAADRSAKFAMSRILVTLQVAVSLALLIGAGLYVRTLWNLRHIALGFNPANVLTFRIAPKRGGYEGERMQQLLDRVTAKIRETPGVRSVTYSQIGLLAGVVWNGSITIPGRTDLPEGSVYFMSVAPEFFTTVQIPLLAGRAVDERDRPGAPRAAVINQHMAQRYFHSAAPLGAQFRNGKGEKAPLYEVVGVVKDAKYERADRDHDMAYVAYAQRVNEETDATFAIRTAGDPRALSSAVRGVMRSIDPNLPVTGLMTEIAQFDVTLRDQRLMAGLAGGFGVLALVLAAIGMYGVIAYSVTRRTAEIGIRMALGAGGARVLGGVMRESLLPVGVGMIAGLGIAWGATKYIASQLYGLDPRDISTMIASALLIALVAIAATLVPARRASRVDPMTALRHE